MNKIVAILVFALFISSTKVQAEIVNSSTWDVSFLQVDDGLPDSTVFSIQQDASGFLWFGTTQGVAKFDGYQFNVLKNDKSNPNSISSNNAGNLYIDSKNRLWVGTFGGGLNVLDLETNQIKRYSYLNNNPNQATISANVQTLFEDDSGRIWVGTDVGLYLINEHQIKHFVHNSDDTTSLGHPRVWDILQTKDKKIWIGTSNSISLYNESTHNFTNFSLPTELQTDDILDEFRTLYADTNQSIWIGASSGLFKFDLKTSSFKYFSPNNHPIKINKITGFKNNQLLVASLDGLFNFDLTSETFNLDENSNVWRKFADFDIRDIKQDKSGLLWLATRYSGVIKINLYNTPFQFHHNSSLDNNSPFQSKRVNAIEKDDQNNLYIGTDETVYKYSNEAKFFKIGFDELDSIPGKIQSLHHSSNANGIWIGSTKGLYFLADSESKASAIKPPFDLANMQPTNVYSIEETQAGDLWLGLFDKGLLYWNPQSGISELNIQNKSNLLTNMSITLTLEDKDHNIWFGSRLGGLFKYNPVSKLITSFTNDPTDSSSISSNLIRDIFQDSENNIWIATSKGLNVFNPQSNSFSRIGSADGLLSDSIQTVLEDQQQNLWIGTQIGMSQWNKTTRLSQNYSLNKNFNNDALIAGSGFIDKSGKVYFGSNNGFYSLSPENMSQQNLYEPPLNLTNIEINHQAINYLASAREFEFNHLDRLISFEFASLDFKAPKQNRYKYRILEISNNWISETNSRKVILNNFQPGTYSIEIMGTNSNGQWSPHSLNLKATIHAAWWDTLLMKLLLVALLLVCIVLIFKLRTYKIRKLNSQLEQEVKHRTQELLTLNQQLEISAHTDYLTGLPNRKSFIKTFKYTLRSHPQHSNNLFVVMADIDHFKHINDNYGHDAGDFALMQLSQLIQSKLRTDEIIARWGGEEFLLCLIDTDSAAIHKFVDGIRLEIEALELNYKSQKLKFSLTFGIAKYYPTMTIDQCIRDADNALYMGKHNGRNQVVMHPTKPN